MEFRKNYFIRKVNLLSGYAYVWPDGMVRIYLGVAKKTNELVFYTVGSVAFEHRPNGSVVLMWGDLQVDSCLTLCNRVMSQPYSFSAVVTYKRMPVIYGALGRVCCSGFLEGWLSRSSRGGLLNYAELK